MAKSIGVGPWGGADGATWTCVPKGDISNISITYGEAINSIIFKSKDQNGNIVDTSDKFGTKDGSQKAEIEIDPKVEKLKTISGTVYDAYNTTRIISSLTFTTTKNNVFGPFGGGRGTAFSLNVDDSHFNGFHGRSGWWLDAIGVNLQLSTTDRVFGPYGGSGGNRWSYKPNGEIVRIFVCYDDVSFRTIQFVSKDAAGNEDTSRQYGTDNSGTKETVTFNDTTGKLIGIIGTYGDAHRVILPTSLSFVTDKNRTLGPYGRPSGTEYRAVVEGSSLTGFHGASGNLIDSIGVSIEPPKTLAVGQWGGSGGEPWTYKPDGTISHISITHGVAINSLTFTSIDDQGSPKTSPTYGTSTGKTDQIRIDVTGGERLNGMSGTFALTTSSTPVITSLSFTTNKNNSHVPLGTANGTSFSLPIINGTITGFSGRHSAQIDAIGAFITSA